VGIAFFLDFARLVGILLHTLFLLLPPIRNKCWMGHFAKSSLIFIYHLTRSPPILVYHRPNPKPQTHGLVPHEKKKEANSRNLRRSSASLDPPSRTPPPPNPIPISPALHHLDFLPPLLVRRPLLFLSLSSDRCRRPILADERAPPPEDMPAWCASSQAHGAPPSSPARVPRPARGRGGLVSRCPHAGDGQPTTWIRGSTYFLISDGFVCKSACV
jgi:hypothetical protein